MSKEAVVPLGRLPKKEAEMFRTVVTCYEQKTYKKGIKTADTILKKFPNHGETLSMKGLINNCMGKKAEAYELVKSGLRNDVRSHICWHVYGLLYRSDNNYKEAIKCYQNALKIDTENQNILRDLSWLQVQMRDSEGFLESRKKILDGRPTLKASWIAYAVSQYHAEQYKAAHDTIKKYFESSIVKKDPTEKYEDSELLLFQNKCLELDGQLEAAIAHLHTHKATIVDQLSWRVKMAELLLLTGQFTEAKAEWLVLVSEQTDNYRFHSGFQAALLELAPEDCRAVFALRRLELPSTELNLSDEQLLMLQTTYEQSQFRSKSLNKIKLTLLRRGAFEAALTTYMQKCLKDGMPALHHDVCSFFRTQDPFNSSRLVFSKDAHDLAQHPLFVFTDALVDKFIANLKQYGTFEAPVTSDNVVPLVELPSAMLWSLYLKCHLLEITGRISEALLVIDECIEHTPTAMDMYAKKARLLKKQGDLATAAVVMDECRTLDLQDRYLNNKATKYFLRADEMTAAMNTIAMFTKHEGDPQKTLYDLQCNWYELEAGESYARSKQWGPALKKFNAVRKHFGDHHDDMFDFHGYSIRKTTLRAYQDILAMQDNAYTHKFYLRATRGVLRIYLHLLDSPEDVDGLGHMTPADRKKERARVKKQKLKEQKAIEDREKAAQAEESWNGSGKKEDGEAEEEVEKKDLDPLGEALLTQDFLAEAGQWVALFTERINLCDSETLALVAEIQMRRGKYLQAVRALSVGLRKDPAHPDLNAALVKVVMKLKLPAGKRPVLQATTSTVVREELAELLGSTDGLAIAVYVGKYVDRVKELNSLPHLVGAAKSLYLSDKSPASVQTIAALFSAPTLWTGRGVNVKNVVSALQYLQSQFAAEAFVAAFRAEAVSRFPLAAFFQAPKEVTPEVAAAVTTSSN